MSKKIINWLLVIIWLSLIFTSSSVPHYPVDLSATGYNIVSDFFHLLLYAVLAVFFVRAFRSSGVPIKKALFYALLSTSFYGALDEYHQSFVPGREMRLSDWLLDAVGALAIVYFYIYKFKIKK